MCKKLEVVVNATARRLQSDREVMLAQAPGDLVDLFLSEAQAHKRLRELTSKLAENLTDVEIARISRGNRIEMKDIFQAMEKITLEADPAKHDRACYVLDLACEGSSFLNYKVLGDMLDNIGNEVTFCIVKIKNRTSSKQKTTSCSCSGVLVNFHFTDNSTRHIVELQFFHDLMIKA